MFGFTKITAGAIAALIALSGIQTYRLHKVNAKVAGIPESVLASLKERGGTESAIAAIADADIAVGVGEHDELADDSEDSAAEYAKSLDRKEREREGLDASMDGSENAQQSQGRKNSSDGAQAEEQKKREQKELKQKTAALINRAQEAAKQGNYDSAIDMLNDCLEMDPTKGDAYRQLSQIYRKLGMTDKEMDVYKNWMENRPDDATPHYQQAALYDSLGMKKEAVEQLRQFQQLAKDNVDAYPMTASLCRKLGLKQEEGEALYAWANSAPGSIDARQNLAQYYARIGDRTSAASEYQALVGLAPSNASVHRGLASAYQGMQNYAGAQTELVTAMNLQPQNMSTRVQLAQVYQRMGDRESALQTYYGVVADAPGTTEARQAQQAINRIQRQIANAQAGAAQKPATTKPKKREQK